jgi:hypothetical protein
VRVAADGAYRNTGVWHSTPVSLLSVEGQRYLVSARGETQWVRNIRVSRTARITRGRESETVHVEEVANQDRPPVLRAYLRAWEWEVGRFFA